MPRPGARHELQDRLTVERSGAGLGCPGMDGIPAKPRRSLPSIPQAVFLAASTAAGVVAVLAICAFLSHRRGMEVTLTAVFLACFAVVKYAVMVRSITETVNPDGSDARELYGTPGRFWIYIGMKGVAATLALGASIYILVHGAAHLT